MHGRITLKSNLGEGGGGGVGVRNNNGRAEEAAEIGAGRSREKNVRTADFSRVAF